MRGRGAHFTNSNSCKQGLNLRSPLFPRLTVRGKFSTSKEGTANKQKCRTFKSSCFVQSLESYGSLAMLENAGEKKNKLVYLLVNATANLSPFQ